MTLLLRPDGGIQSTLIVDFDSANFYWRCRAIWAYCETRHVLSCQVRVLPKGLERKCYRFEIVERAR